MPQEMRICGCPVYAVPVEFASETTSFGPLLVHESWPSLAAGAVSPSLYEFGRGSKLGPAGGKKT